MKGVKMVDDAYVPIEKVAEYFAISVSTVRNWIRKKDIPALKLGGVYRLKLSEVEAKFRNTEAVVNQEVIAEIPTPEASNPKEVAMKISHKEEISPKELRTVEELFKDHIKGTRIGNNLKDILYVEGYRSSNFDRSDKSEIAIKFHESIKQLFIAEMDSQAQELLAKPLEGLNNTQQQLQQLHRNDISTKFGNLYKAMQKREKAKIYTIETTVSGKKIPLTGNQLICRTIMEQIAKLQEINSPCDQNREIIKDLENAVKKFNDCKIFNV